MAQDHCRAAFEEVAPNRVRISVDGIGVSGSVLGDSRTVAWILGDGVAIARVAEARWATVLGHAHPIRSAARTCKLKLTSK